ncbi:MAG TPA: cupin domain-containing protein [Aliidongia sp.]|uniref:cupin domain-containing protein n=1 Tax=Aliidongia sp. TaxID=1914230 RepID=UPI002DDCC9A1|nr:cupin domain-containing protein [Aliidongia sp.]HEV2676993.1 cupin domain-containing protein [Aliidongia sp.]
MRISAQTTALGLAATASLALVLWSPLMAPGGMHHAAMITQASDAGSEIQAQRPVTTVRPVSCEKLPNVPGKSLTTAVVSFPPDAYTPRHRHPGSVTAFVLKGTVRSQLAGGPIETFTAGQSWFEPPGTIHLFAENASPTEPAELLSIFVADNDCGPLIVLD